MKLKIETPKKSLNKAFLKQRPLRSNVDTFKSNLKVLLDKINIIDQRPKDESEEHLKNDIRDFLRDTYYKETNAINTKDKKDLVIHVDKTTDSKVGVIIEAKRPSNVSEMLSVNKPNTKALHELVLYFMRERVDAGNIDLKYLVATNIHEWYIIEASYFEKHFYKNKQFIRDYEDWRDGKKVTKDTNLFYNEIAKPFIDKIDEEVTCTYFNIRKYEKELNNNDSNDDKVLIALLKILSPNHLLKVPFANDSNELNQNFYKELLHIIGLEEIKEGTKNIIRRKNDNRQEASLLEKIIEELKTEGLHKVPDVKYFGETKDEQLFNISLELCITWINRILFLKLLEGQLINYHKGDRQYRFLNSDIIPNFDELFKLFHKVLAVDISERSPASLQQKYSRVPYLNSSLFEISELEDVTIKVNALDNSDVLEFFSSTVLKEKKKKNEKLNTLEYLFKFLDAFDFASEEVEDIQEDNKTLINASVLGKVFEKINGYKDGSIFTPGFITMYMCSHSIKLAILKKFNEIKKWNLNHFDELYNKIDDIEEANNIVNSIKICDPAVGSGHFLVSALNEIIAIKSELRILKDKYGKRLKEYSIEVINDELIITDEDGDIFEYSPQNKESQRVQETLFNEKKVIIENCLFGVDINPNSVKICRLRLWIELLKNAYYKEKNESELETLPNIDINIKCGNSLLSRFTLDADLKPALSKSKTTISSYRNAVFSYKNSTSKDDKRELLKLINKIKNDFVIGISSQDKKIKDLNKKRNELFLLTSKTKLFEGVEMVKGGKKKEKEKIDTLNKEIADLEKQIEDQKNNIIYKNAFEWRFEFPEILNNAGDYEGFDIIIGNPPYFSISKDQNLKSLQNSFQTFDSTGDIYCLFYEKGAQLLKTNGILYYITSNKWMRANYGQKLRYFFSHRVNPIFLFDFSWYQVFDNASVDSNILGFIKEENQNKVLSAVAEKDFEISELVNYIETKAAITSYPDDNYWTIADREYTALKSKLTSVGKPLGEWEMQIYRGILTGYNEAFIVDEATKDELIKRDKKSAEIIKPLIRGRDVERFSYNFEKLWLIFTRRGIDIELYPAVKQHLLQFKEDLTPKKSKDQKRGRKAGSYQWYEIQDNIAYYKEFEKEKLVWAETMRVHKTGDRNFPRFGFDTNGIYTDKTIFIGVGKHLKYLLAFLNSTIGKWLVMEYVTKLDTGGYMMQKIFLDKIPVYVPEEDDEKLIIKIVDELIAAQKKGLDTLKYEKEINEAIFRLYKLSAKEIKAVEGK